MSRLPSARRLLSALALPLAVGACHAPGPATVPTIQGDAILSHVTFLADDARQGRGTGTVGCEEAARYVAHYFGIMGLKPGGDFGTFYQHFEASTGRRVAESTTVSVAGISLVRGEDYQVSDVAGLSHATGPLQFVGYGIHAPDLDHDDYAGREVEGRILVAWRGAPGRQQGEGAFLDTAPGGLHSRDRKKAETAFQKGAAGLILLPDPDLAEEPALPVFRGDRGQGLSLPVLLVTQAVADRILAKGRPGPDLGGLQGDLRLVLEEVIQPTANVVGLWPGEGPHRDEVIVLGAHYDHLGLGGAGSLSGEAAVHNGADDNASGTGALLEIARACVAAGPFDRTLVFVAFSGEELGLLGSDWYVQHPALPLEDTVAMLNLDMVGRSKDGYCAVGAVGSSTAFAGLPEQVNEALGLGLRLEVADGGMAAGSSDHQSFLNHEVPSLFFFSGLHEDYHQPTDDAERINPEGAERIARLAFGILQRLDQRREAPAWQAPAAPSPTGEPDRERPAGERPWFGSVPSFGDTGGEGMLMERVTEGSPAWDAGLRGGDLLVEFGGRPVRSLQDFATLLGGTQVGDRVPVVVLRGEERISATVLLRVRP